MTLQQNNQDSLVSDETRLKEAQVENELLLVQIHQLEEELEQYFLRNQDIEKGQQIDPPMNATGKGVWVDDELPDTIAENQRLHALIGALQKAHELVTNNALNVKLGNILIQGVDSPGSLLAVPGKIGKIWRESTRKNPPNTIGGKGYDKVKTAYVDGGFKAVEKLFSGVSLVTTMQANAYTVLARHIMKSDRAATAEAARRAYEIDPQPFRLKWLAFRLHEAGEVIKAEAMLDILPPDITFSESEARQASQLRNESKHVRQHEAKQKTRFLERRAEIERQLASLSREREEQASQIEELNHSKEQEEEENELLLHQISQMQKELESQYLKCQTFEQEKMEVARQKDEQTKLVDQCQARIEKLKQGKTSVEAELSQHIETLKQDKAQEKEKNELFQNEIFQELESQYVRNEILKKEKAELTKLTEEQQEKIEQLRQEKATVEEELGNQIEALNQSQALLDQERVALANQKDKQAKLAVELQSQVEQLTQAKTVVEVEYGQEIEALKLEKSALAGKKDKQSKLVVELQAQVEQLTQAKTVVEAEYGQEIEVLKQQVQAKLTSETELSQRQQVMHEEMVRAEAQLDLIKDVLLREPGL